MRKEVADLLRINKQESARIRVEGVIRENLMLQACPQLHPYCCLQNFGGLRRPSQLVCFATGSFCNLRYGMFGNMLKAFVLSCYWAD